MPSLISGSALAWVMKITLASSPLDSSYYEFVEFQDCMAAVAPVEILYENLGDPAKVECIPAPASLPRENQDSELFPSFEGFEDSSFKNVKVEIITF